MQVEPKKSHKAFIIVKKVFFLSLYNFHLPTFFDLKWWETKYKIHCVFFVTYAFSAVALNIKELLARNSCNI